MDKYLLQLKNEFGKYGSWAIWDEDGCIAPLISKNNFEILIKPNIIFLGLNASIKLPNDWINYHSECQEFKKKKWGQEFIKNLADLIMSDEFSTLRGAYMTDIIKDVDFPESSKVMAKIKNNPEILSRSKEIFEKELSLLSKIFLTDKFQVICMGRDAFDILCRIWDIPTKKVSNKMRSTTIERRINTFEILEIYHYAYRKKEKIKQDLREITKNVR